MPQASIEWSQISDYWTRMEISLATAVRPVERPPLLRENRRNAAFQRQRSEASTPMAPKVPKPQGFEPRMRYQQPSPGAAGHAEAGSV